MTVSTEAPLKGCVVTCRARRRWREFDGRPKNFVLPGEAPKVFPSSASTEQRIRNISRYTGQRKFDHGDTLVENAIKALIRKRRDTFGYIR